MNCLTIEQVDSSYYDLSHISRRVQHLRFSCVLPSSLSDILLATLTNAPSASKKTDGDANRFGRNDNQNEDWIVLSTVKLGDLFNQDSMKKVPMFNDSYQCCPLWASKGHYFKSFKNKESHTSWSKSQLAACDTWQKKCRQA